MQQEVVVDTNYTPLQHQVIKFLNFIGPKLKIKTAKEMISKFEGMNIKIAHKLELKKYRIELGKMIICLSLNCEQGPITSALILRQFCEYNDEIYWESLHYLQNFRENYLKLNLQNNIQLPSDLIALIKKCQNIRHKYFCQCQEFKKTNQETKISKKNSERCSQCLELYHPDCQSQVLFCNKCYLKHSQMPVASCRTIQMYYCGYFKVTNMLNLIKFKCPYAEQARLEQSPSFDVRLRIILSEQILTANKHCGVILTFCINSQILKKLRLQDGKKTNDIKIPLKYLSQSNILIIKNQSKINPKKKQSLFITQSLQTPILIGVMRTVPRNKKKDLILNSFPRINQNPLFQFYSSINKRLYKKTKIQVSLFDSPSKKKVLQVPCRGLNCQHIQCFDYSLVQSQNKKIHCPYCQKEVYGLYIDTVFESYLMQMKENKSLKPTLTLLYESSSFCILKIEELKKSNKQIIID